MSVFDFVKNILSKPINFARNYRQFSALDTEDQTDLLGILHETNVKNYLLKYSYILNKQPEHPQKGEYKDKIWQVWYQGVDQAPKIARRCIDTVREFSGGRNVIMLNEKNIENYISIPGYIFDKKKKGYISHTHFSDVLRYCLLAEHGGTWIDSTVMLTGQIPNHILNVPLFCFSTTPKAFRGVGNILASSWFIHSIPDHIIIKSTRNLVLEYWKYETDVRHYYLFHLMFTTVILLNEDCKREWGRVPFFSNMPPQVLQMELFEIYNEERFEQIKQMSPIHKLTHSGKEFDPEKSDTFYDVLINKELKC